MNRTTSSTPRPQRVHLHAYERLSRLCAEIQRGRYPTKATLARLVERSPRTVQNNLRALRCLSYLLALGRWSAMWLYGIRKFGLPFRIFAVDSLYD